MIHVCTSLEPVEDPNLRIDKWFTVIRDGYSDMSEIMYSHNAT